MSQPRKDRLRNHLAARAGRRGLVLGGAGLAALGAGAGVFTGVNLAAAGSTAANQNIPAPLPNRTGSSAATAAPGCDATQPTCPGAVTSAPLTLLFTRTTATGVTMRVYGQGSLALPGCSTSPPCPSGGTSTGPTPCLAGVTCVRPLPAAGPDRSGTGQGSPVPGVQGAGCGQLVVELSTDQAVSTGLATWPTEGTPGSGPVDVLGNGAFGAAEGGAVSWVAVEAGSGVSSVRLSSATGAADEMTPVDGIAVLAQPGGTGLAGATVAAVGPDGARIAGVPAFQMAGTITCAAPIPPTTTTTTTSPTSTTTPTLPPPPAPVPTTTTTPSGPPTPSPAPGPTLPVAPSASRPGGGG